MVNVLDVITKYLEEEFDHCELEGPDFSLDNPWRRFRYWLTDGNRNRYTIHFTEAFIIDRIGWQPQNVIGDLIGHSVVEVSQRNINEIIVVRSDCIEIE